MEVITLEIVKTQLLERIAAELKNGEHRGFEYLEPLVMAYGGLCSTEMMCKCPTRDEDDNGELNSGVLDG